MKARPIKNWIFVRLCLRAEKVSDEHGVRHERDGIVIPDQIANGFVRPTGSWATILSTGPECVHFEPEHVGMKVALPEYKPRELMFIAGDDWAVKETLFISGEAPLMVVET